MKSLEASESARASHLRRIVPGPVNRSAYLRPRAPSALSYGPRVEANISTRRCRTPSLPATSEGRSLHDQDPAEFRTDPTRLETRTKESDMCASAWVANPGAERNRVSVRSRPVFAARGSTTGSALFLLNGASQEHPCRDPKDGELCLCRAKSGETLMEARSDTDVQIVRLT